MVNAERKLLVEKAAAEVLRISGRFSQLAVECCADGNGEVTLPSTVFHMHLRNMLSPQPQLTLVIEVGGKEITLAQLDLKVTPEGMAH